MNDENKAGPRGPNQADELKSIAAELEQAEQAEGVQGEYQPGEKAKPENPGPSTGEMIAGLLSITFNKVLAPKRGRHWELTNKEAEAAGDAYGALLDKYFPGFSIGPEGAAVAVTLVVFGPRVAIDAQIAKARRAQAEDEPKPAGDDKPKPRGGKSDAGTR